MQPLKLNRIAYYEGPLANIDYGAMVKMSKSYEDLSEFDLGTLKIVGRGASSVVFTDGKKVYKIAHYGVSVSWSGGKEIRSTPEKALSERKGLVNEIKKLNGKKIPIKKTIIHYSSYKQKKERGESVDLPKNARYDKDSKSFVVDMFYTISDLNIEMRDDGIIIQDIYPKNSTPIDNQLAKLIYNYIKTNFHIYIDMMGVLGNMRTKDGILYILDL